MITLALSLFLSIPQIYFCFAIKIFVYCTFLVLAGGKPLDLCSGGMIWSCCVDRELHQESNPTLGAVQNASKWYVLCICNVMERSIISLSFRVRVAWTQFRNQMKIEQNAKKKTNEN